MIRINLLPHREAKRQRQILQHIAAAVAVLGLAVALSIGLHVIYSSMLSGLQDEEARLIEENRKVREVLGKIEHLDKLRTDVENKLDVVGNLQKGRFRSLNTLVSFSMDIPGNVWLTDIKDENGNLSISGIAESNRAVARFLRLLERSELFDDVRLVDIERKDIDGVPIRTFNINLKRVDPPEQQEPGAEEENKA